MSLSPSSSASASASPLPMHHTQVRPNASNSSLVDADSRGALSSARSDPNSDSGSASPVAQTPSDISRQALVVVDPLSTGANVADVALRRGAKVITVWSQHHEASVSSLTDDTLRHDFLATLTFDSSCPAETVRALRYLESSHNITIIGVVAGSEPGVEVADLLGSDLYGLGLSNSNGLELSTARRDKVIMQETIAAAGIRSARQVRATTFEQVEQFLADTAAAIAASSNSSHNAVPASSSSTLDLSSAFPIVLKPLRSAGSDGIFKCNNLSEARTAFDSLFGTKNQLGSMNDAVVAQSYLHGLEYIVDTVSRNGVHKVVAIWSYDKRTVHGQDFVYFGMWSINGASEIGKTLSEYTVSVLDALQIMNGAGHAEVILTPTGPCLVEVGARPHGCEGTFMPCAARVWGEGRDQVTALVDSYLAPEAFHALPDRCGEELEACYKLDLVSSVSGRLVKIQFLKEIEALPSFLKVDMLPKPGDQMHVTVDCFTACGSVSLVHKDRKQVERDAEVIRGFEATMFVVEEAQR